jgi:hypothetical protein
VSPTISALCTTSNRVRSDRNAMPANDSIRDPSYRASLSSLFT